LLLATPLLSFFIDDNVTATNPQEKIDMVYSVGKSFLFIVVPFYIVIATKLASDGILRGSRMMKQFMAATLLDLILRVGLSFLFDNIGGVEAIWWSWPIGWFLSLLMSLAFSLSRYKKNNNEIIE
jgi:Na+-driven multidrug efflux pump